MGRKQKQKQGTGQKKNTGAPNLGEMIQRALYCQQTGFLKEAEAIYKKILKFDPDQPDSLHYLGLIYYQKGRDELALKHIERSIRINNRNPDYYNNYGLVLSKQNKFEEAEKACKKAIDLKQDFAEAWYNLGVAYYEQGDLETSEMSYKKAIVIRPDYIKALRNLASVQKLLEKNDAANMTVEKILNISPDTAEAHNTLGMTFQMLGGVNNLKIAEQHYRNALKIKPDYLEAYINLGGLFQEGNQINDALKCFNLALKLEPGYRDAMLSVGLALIKDEQIVKAQDYLLKVIEKYPGNTPAITGLGDIKRIKGEFIEAEKLYNEALNINEREYGAYSGLSQCKKHTTGDNEIIKKIKSLRDVNLNPYLCFTLGKIYDDLGDYDKAFRYYKKANEIKNNRIDYNANEHSIFIDRIINIFSKELIDRLQAGGHKTELPIFIVGTPRSGTTLTEQIISSHPQVYGAGELSYISQLAKNTPVNINSNLGFPEWLEMINQSDILSQAEHYLNKLRPHCSDSEICRITDKMPGNYQYLGYITILFPNAKIIHCKRNPLDSCLSIYVQHFQAGHRYSFDLENLAHWYKDYLRLMNHWSQLLGDRIFNVEYSDIVNNVEETAKKLIEYCGLEWDEQCIQFYQTHREVMTASQWQVRQPIYQTSMDRWKRYEKHIGVLKEILAGTY
jgi:tetratricopeptide (TPR) repeat protein